MPLPRSGVYIFPFKKWLEGLWGKNMTSHDRMKNTPQRNGEETWMENELLQSKLKQKFILLMKIKGNLYILQSCQMFSWDYFQFWEETYSQWYLGKKAKDHFTK